MRTRLATIPSPICLLPLLVASIVHAQAPATQPEDGQWTMPGKTYSLMRFSESPRNLTGLIAIILVWI